MLSRWLFSARPGPGACVPTASSIVIDKHFCYDDCQTARVHPSPLSQPPKAVLADARHATTAPPLTASLIVGIESALLRVRTVSYVPKAYLDRWKKGHALDVVDTSEGLPAGKARRRPQVPRDTCSERDFYRMMDPDGTYHLQLERVLSVLDGELASVLTEVDQWQPGTKSEFDGELYVSLSVMAATQLLRTPQWRRLEIEAAEIVSGQRYGEDWVKQAQSKQLISEVAGYIDCFASRCLRIYTDPTDSIPTCDVPVLVVLSGIPRLADVVTADRIWWPIGPSKALCFVRPDSDSSIKMTVEPKVLSKGALRDELISAIKQGHERLCIEAPDGPSVFRERPIRSKVHAYVRCRGALHQHAWMTYSNGPKLGMCAECRHRIRGSSLGRNGD